MHDGVPALLFSELKRILDLYLSGVYINIYIFYLEMAPLSIKV